MRFSELIFFLKRLFLEIEYTVLELMMQNLQEIDINVLRCIYENRIPVLDSTFIIITDSAAAIAFGVPGVALIISYIKKNPFIRRNALMILLSVAFSAIVANVLKYSIDLPRPYEIYPFIKKLSVGGSPSFPSGHTTDAFAFAMAVSLLYRKWLLILPCLVWAVLVGYTRMILGVHFPSDVLAGAFIGITCTTALYWFWSKREIKQR